MRWDPLAQDHPHGRLSRAQARQPSLVCLLRAKAHGNEPGDTLVKAVVQEARLARARGALAMLVLLVGECFGLGHLDHLEPRQEALSAPDVQSREVRVIPVAILDQRLLGYARVLAAVALEERVTCLPEARVLWLALCIEHLKRPANEEVAAEEVGEALQVEGEHPPLALIAKGVHGRVGEDLRPAASDLLVVGQVARPHLLADEGLAALLQCRDALPALAKVLRIGEVLPTLVLQPQPEVTDNDRKVIGVGGLTWQVRAQRRVQESQVPIDRVWLDIVDHHLAAAKRDAA
mmetsp:Transcript_42987/g.115882  ORF Transcript_42987/g.115882 Transcript_42987/m.115882 type:complete len:291 (-) Transcript_42987:87-959(-)